MTDADDARLIDDLVAIAITAGQEAMRIYGGEFDVEHKGDSSPVTEADRRCEAIILDGLAEAAPNIPVLAEESASEGEIPADLGEEFFLVDPLDGTKEFINRTGEFTINIALSRRNHPVLGVVFAPAIGKLYAGAVGEGAFRIDVNKDGPGPRQPIRTRRAPAAGLVAVASRSHRSPETDAFLKTLDVADFAAAGSSLKFCLIAEGAADIYPRLGRTMEWDTAAGQAVLEAAGGRVVTHPEGAPLAYAKAERGYDNPHFIAWGQ